MKIGLESQLLLNHHKTGVGWCADNLICTLASGKDNEYQMNYFSLGSSSEVKRKMENYQEQGLHLRPCRWFHAVWYKLIWPFVPVPYRWFFGRDCDVTQFFNFFVPPGVRGKTVTIVHDMAYKACPETVKSKTRRWLELVLESSCKRADVIVTVSEFSKKELMGYLEIPEEKIRVMYPGVNLTLFCDRQPQARIDLVREKYGIRERYLLYLGTIEPRKNIKRLIQAYAMLRRKEKDIPQLVLAGGRGWLCDDIYKTAEELNMGDDILFTGYVEEEESPVLLSGAEIFLFPSLYEGFGIPPVEAMACGTPVLSSDRASLPEVLGDAAWLVDPESVEDICAAMERLIKDEPLRQELSGRGKVQSQRYTWERAARTLAGIYKELDQKKSR